MMMVRCEVLLEKDVWGWHVESYEWCTSEGKSPLGNKVEWIGFVHNPHRGLKAYKEVETHM